MRCDATGNHLQLLVSRAIYEEILKQAHDSMICGHLVPEKDEGKHYRGSTGVVYRKIVIIGLPNVMNVLE